MLANAHADHVAATRLDVTGRSAHIQRRLQPEVHRRRTDHQPELAGLDQLATGNVDDGQLLSGQGEGHRACLTRLQGHAHRTAQLLEGRVRLAATPRTQSSTTSSPARSPTLLTVALISTSRSAGILIDERRRSERLMDEPDATPRRTELATELIVRESSGPPPARARASVPEPARSRR